MITKRTKAPGEAGFTLVQGVVFCWVCDKQIQVGEETIIKQVPILFRWGKQRKKAKANTHYGLRAHSQCFEVAK